MTGKKGSQWKSSWNRSRGTPTPEPVGDMAYFQNFYSGGGSDQARYSTVVPSTLGASLPFWFAAVGVRTGGQSAFVAPIPSAFLVQPESEDGLIDPTGTLSGEAFAPELAVAGDDFVSATLVTVVADGAGFFARVYLDDQVSEAVYGTSFTAAAGALIMDPFALPGALHGFAGGDIIPTGDEIRAWFRALKASLAIQAIPGKTSHLYSASPSFPLVPATLVNLANPGTQDMTLTTLAGTPAPANVLIPTRFPY